MNEVVPVVFSSKLYRSSLCLCTDFYQVTMAYAAWKNGLSEREAVFTLSFRRGPFGGAFVVGCGLASAVAHMRESRFDQSDLDYLAEQRGVDGGVLFEPGFLDYLAGLSLACDLDAVEEGTVVFAQEPLLRVRGPIIPAMLLETPLLNLVNFQSLVATKAARICQAAGGDPVIEFGLRRAQGTDGALSASRAAYIGGCSGTSNVLAGKLFGIPVRGTHAHSWVMIFDQELDAFFAYARAMPNNSILLVDTYDTLAGVKKAIEVGRWLRAQGHKLTGIRLDSGDLASLSIEARQLLDAAGLEETSIVASNALDEDRIQSLKQQGAAIVVWGVGTRLVTGHPDAALDAVYKLGAVRVRPDAAWSYRMKLSEQAAKATMPGILQVRRYQNEHGFCGDLIYEEGLGLSTPTEAARGEDLLVPILRGAELVREPPSIDAIRERARDQLARLEDGVKRLGHPDEYPVTVDRGLQDLRNRLMLEARWRG
jgi:nicotinate phosphoribosyltransferase